MGGCLLINKGVVTGIYVGDVCLQGMSCVVCFLNVCGSLSGVD